MADTITGVNVAQNLTDMWGIQACEYKFGSLGQIDFQDLMVAICENRATSVEDEVTPLTTRIRQRNERLSELGDALSDVTKAQQSFENDDGGDVDMRGTWFKDSTAAILIELGYTLTKTYSTSDDVPEDREERGDFYKVEGNAENNRYSANKKTIEGMAQKLKSTIDDLNNESQTDMTRLQSLVDRRDESYSTATTLMTDVSDTRSTTIRNM